MGNLFAPHRAIHIVSPEIQCHRGYLLGEHDPVGFDMRDVIQHQAGDGDHLQVVDRRGEPMARFNAGVPRLEGQWDKCQKPAGLILCRPEPEHVINTFFDGLDMAVEDCAVGRDPELMRRRVDFKPSFRSNLGAEQQFAHPFGKDLRPPTGHRSQPGLLQLP